MTRLLQERSWSVSCPSFSQWQQPIAVPSTHTPPGHSACIAAPEQHPAGLWCSLLQKRHWRVSPLPQLWHLPIVKAEHWLWSPCTWAQPPTSFCFVPLLGLYIMPEMLMWQEKIFFCMVGGFELVFPAVFFEQEGFYPVLKERQHWSATQAQRSMYWPLGLGSPHEAVSLASHFQEQCV